MEIKIMSAKKTKKSSNRKEATKKSGKKKTYEKPVLRKVEFDERDSIGAAAISGCCGCW